MTTLTRLTTNCFSSFELQSTNHKTASAEVSSVIVQITICIWYLGVTVKTEYYSSVSSCTPWLSFHHFSLSCSLKKYNCSLERPAHFYTCVCVLIFCHLVNSHFEALWFYLSVSLCLSHTAHRVIHHHSYNNGYSPHMSTQTGVTSCLAYALFMSISLFLKGV